MRVNEINIFDREEVYTDCTVQILSNSVTGETSIAWWRTKKLQHGVWHSSDETPPRREECYLVLWKSKTPHNPHDCGLFYEIVYYDEDGCWSVDDDIPQALGTGGAVILYWMELPERPRGA